MNKKKALKKIYIISQLEKSGFFDNMINLEPEYGYSWKGEIDDYIKNIINYKDFLYSNRNWYFPHIFDFLYIKLKETWIGCVDNGHTVSSTKKRYQRDLKTCIELCNRLKGDEDYYWDLIMNKSKESNFKKIVYSEKYCKDYYYNKKQKQDRELLFNIIKRNINNWVD